jgi:NADPH:quinone reductase
MKAITFSRPGGPEVLEYKDIPKPQVSEGQVLVRTSAIGLNFIDIYHRTGLYKLPLPAVPGMEAAGIVEETDGVSEFRKGDRVAYAMVPGAYSEFHLVPSSKLVKVPDGIELSIAAAAMLQGMTAHYLTTSTYKVNRGDTVLVHAAAGGVGLLLIQMCKRVGATVIGTVSNSSKAELAKEAGADHLINYRTSDFEHEVAEITKGRGLEVVYDSVGKETFIKSLSCLAPRGMCALFGQSSGPVEPFDPAILAQKGSLFLTRPSLAQYTLTREELLWRANDVLGWVAKGEIKIRIDRTFSLADAATAHKELESRRTTGKVLLNP